MKYTILCSYCGCDATKLWKQIMLYNVKYYQTNIYSAVLNNKPKLRAPINHQTGQ